jgi:hypothetical protein
MTEIGHGDIIQYSYLWAREHAQGEITGRKTRPACVMLVVTGADGRKRTLIFPITSQQPSPDTSSIEIPETEARRANLCQPAWVIVDELNQDDLTKSFALEDLQPQGRFSKKFMLKLTMAVRAVAQARKMKIITRK